MKRRNFILIFLILLISFLCIGNGNINSSKLLFADVTTEREFLILDEFGQVINGGYDCQEGDMFVAGDNILYEIYHVDFESGQAYAREKVKVQLPKVEKNVAKIKPIKSGKKAIGIYHTHNDESYVLGDGYDSVYGEGGIVDIGDLFMNELKKKNITVYKNDTLHLPHDGNAYTRSKKTSQKLLNDYSLDAIFDVHRDGVPRNQFLGSVNGKSVSKINYLW